MKSNTLPPGIFRGTKVYVDRSFKVSTVKLSEGKKLLFFDLHGQKDL